MALKPVVERGRAFALEHAAPILAMRAFSAAQWREFALIAAPAVALLVGAFWLASKFIEPAPPRSIAITTGGPTGAYFGFGKRYAEILARSGITLDVRSSAGSLENVARLNDPNSGIDVALLQGGIADQTSLPGVISIGRMFLEPIWVFYRGAETVDRLAQLKGRRIGIGPAGSGTGALATALLKPNGVTAETATLLAIGNGDAIAALKADQLDAIFLAQAPESSAIQALLNDPSVKLMSFSQAEAYTRLFPYLTRIVLPKGAFDLVKNIPATDMELVAPVAALVARELLHPALVGLLVEAARTTHRGGGLFTRSGEFPKPFDPEFELSEDAERIYKVGPPFLQRFLPFWLATFIERMKILVLPIAAILLPLIKIIPAVYKWRIRRRVLYWYGEIRRLDKAVAGDSKRSERNAHRAEIKRIDDAVAAIPMPLAFTEQYYALRAAIDLVRNRLAAV